MARCTNIPNFISLGPVNVMFFFFLVVSAGRPVLRREHRETTTFLEGYFLSGSSLVYGHCCLLSARALIDTG